MVAVQGKEKGKGRVTGSKKSEATQTNESKHTGQRDETRRDTTGATQRKHKLS